jgi:hypothetical protein
MGDDDEEVRIGRQEGVRGREWMLKYFIQQQR